MATNSFLERLRFLWRANGRHGTHSPFVYTFVEQVLRHRAIARSPTKKLSNRDWSIMLQTIAYLKPDQLFVDDALEQSLFSLLATNTINLEITRLSKLSAIEIKNGLIFLWMTNNIEAKMKQIKSFSSTRQRLAVYIIHPHQSGLSILPIAYEKYSDFKMVLDFWRGLLLVKNPDFRQQQFFELR